MKAELLIDMKGANPDFDRKKFFDLSNQGLPYSIPSKISIKAGTIIDDPQCFWLVRFGCAKPADEECMAANPGWSEELAEERLAVYKKTAAGKLTGDTKYDAE